MPPPPLKRGGGGANPNSSVVYIGSIPFDWDENVIKSLVAGTGNVVDVRIGFDYAGKNKGFCFIEYQNPQWAHQAIVLLNQIQLIMPNSQSKRLRIESSKESLKANKGFDMKQVIALNDRNALPNYVHLPPQMLSVVPYSPNRVDSPSMNNFQQQPQYQQPQYQQSQQPQQFQRQQPYNNYNPTPPQQNIPLQSQQPQVSIKYTQATKNMAQVTNLPFETNDVINQTLSKIPPAQLIEVIANLKNMVNGPDAARVHEVLKMSPDLATTAAQALLLMGFIDGDVITESTKAATNIPNNGPGIGSQYSAPGFQPQYSTPPPPPPPATQSRWPNLSLKAQQKLLELNPDQAELIAQVLNLPPDQIRTLPSDKQTMVQNLRAQYL